jgi:hypothetical protein
MSALVGRAVSSSIATLLISLALPARSAAQFGATVDLNTGPAAWDQTDGGDALLKTAFAATYQVPSLLGLTPELVGDFGLSSRPAEQAGFAGDVGARLHTSGINSGVWLGAAGGTAGTRERRTQLTRLEAGVRRVVGPARINVWLSRTGFGSGVTQPGGLGQDSSGSSDSLRRNGVSEYTELGSQAALRLNRYELGLSLTQRMGSAAVRRTGWELSATWWVAPSIGVVGATGHSLPEFGFTIPGARYGTVGLRLALGARSPGDAPRGRATRSRSTAAPTLVVADRLLTFQWASARRAEVMGDFTDWRPEPLVALRGGRWAHQVALSPGVHHLNVRFDGGPWLVPAGAIPVDDEFGGTVGLVVVR